MDEKIKKNGDFAEINLKRILDALLHRVWSILFASVVGALLVFAITYFFVTPQYESAVMFYVNNSSISVGGTSLSIDSSDISASKSLVNTYIVILNTDETMSDVIDYAKVRRGSRELKDMITAEAVDDTEVFRVVVTSADPAEANKIADAISYILPKRISNIVEGTSAKIVDHALMPARPSSPSYVMNAMLGFLLGLVLAVGLTVVREMMDITIRKEDDIHRVCNHPILAFVPDMNAPTKSSGSYYHYGDDRRKKKGGAYIPARQGTSHNAVIGAEIGFAASEAYKLLRTKLQFSFSDDNDCHVIGISSSLSGEGKSLTSINLAFSLSQLDKKVLLVDCDMRRPTLAEKLKILKQPGLSSYLTRQCPLDELVQMCGLKNNEHAFHVIAAGQNPPNPIELLSSDRMKKALAAMREAYDYVILDLPPVGEVSDAMAVAKDTDGMLLVVRQNHCDSVALADAVHQFDFIQSKILGVVFNCTGEYGSHYGKGYYKQYYRRGYHRYYKNYETSNRSVSGAEGKGKAK